MLINTNNKFDQFSDHIRTDSYSKQVISIKYRKSLPANIFWVGKYKQDVHSVIVLLQMVSTGQKNIGKLYPK